MTVAAHDHRRGYPLRRLPDRPGVYVQVHGDWDRPLHVWLYRGAWRAICRPCMDSIRSDDETYNYGWPTQAAAFDAAVRHCGDCQTADPPPDGAVA
jgi:hypothetical protein